MLFPEQLRDLLDHLEPVHGLQVVLDTLIVLHTGLMHALHQVNRDRFGILIKVFLSFDLNLSSVVHELRVTLKSRQKYVALSFGFGQLEGGVVLRFHVPIDLHFVYIDRF